MSSHKITDQRKMHPAHHLAEAMVLGSESAITAQERQGGAELQTQDSAEWVSVPSEMKGHDRFGAAVRWTSEHDVADFEALGFEFDPGDRAVMMKVAELKSSFEERRRPLYADYANSREKLDDARRQEHEQVTALWGERDELFVRARLPGGWHFEDAGHRYGYWTHIEDAEGFERVAIFYKAAFYDRRAHMGITTVPETKPQRDAWETIYAADDVGYKSDDLYWGTAGPHWSDPSNAPIQESIEDRSVLHRLYWATDRRCREIVIAPDGTITRDEIGLPLPE